MKTVCKLYDFEEYDDKEDNVDLNGKKIWGDNKQLKVRMFGMNEIGETFSIIVEGFHPFFYVKVPENWTKSNKMSFYNHIRNLDEMK